LSSGELRIRPLRGLPEVREGSDLGALVADAAAPADGEIVVLSQKIVSKAEGLLRSLDAVEVTEQATTLAREVGKDPRLVALILEESRSIVRAAPGVLITETVQGWICANAGIDASNVAQGDWVALLPEDPDASARRIRAELRAAGGSSPGVVIADSFGRPWRLGQADVAIGCAGVLPLEDWRGRPDSGGRPLEATEIASADEIAAAADLVRRKDSGEPGAVLSGLERLVTSDDGPGAAALRRPEGEDLFR
jgi:coenzyme F420-0:L-glutamate ligase/coenzyme F420-1:gamma-L-glutamate ligase